MSGHALSVGRRQRGKTAIRPTRPLYASTGRCSCGWTGRSNRAPSQGGRRDLLDQHEHDTGERAEVLR